MNGSIGNDAFAAIPVIEQKSPIVLTVDDEPDIRGIIADEPREEGFHVVHAPDGQTALSMVRTYRPDVIIMGLVMPTMNGLQFLNRLDLMQAGAPSVIVTSGLSDPSILKACKDADASLLIDNPFHLADLTIAVRNASR